MIFHARRKFAPPRVMYEEAPRSAELPALAPGRLHYKFRYAFMSNALILLLFNAREAFYELYELRHRG